MPLANRFTLHLLAAVAEYESQLISERVKGAFVVARAQGRKFGLPKGQNPPCLTAAAHAKGIQTQKDKADNRARDLAPLLCALRDQGESVRGIAQYLSIYGIQTPTGLAEWTRLQVRRSFARVGEALPLPRVTQRTREQRVKWAGKHSLASLLG